MKTTPTKPAASTTTTVNPGLTSRAIRFAEKGAAAVDCIRELSIELHDAWQECPDIKILGTEFGKYWQKRVKREALTSRTVLTVCRDAGFPEPDCRKLTELIAGVSRSAISATAKAMAAGSRSAAGLKNHGAPTFSAARVAEILKGAGCPLTRQQIAALAKAAAKAAK